MSKSGSYDDLQKIIRGYRIEVHCLHCNSTYFTNLLKTLKMPRKCKYCSSTRIEPLDVRGG